MARILILLSQPIVDKQNPSALVCFYESFIKELLNYNNIIKVCNTFFVKKYWESEITILSKTEKEKFIEDIKQYKPDIIFTFNNQITEEIIDNTSCPICLLDADGFDFFSNKEFIKKYYERYYLFSFTQGWEEDKYINFGIEKQKISYLHMATSIKKEKLQKTENITFIGTKFTTISKKIQKSLLIQQDLYLNLQMYYKNQYEFHNSFINKYPNFTERDLDSLLDPRCYILQSIWDLGLKIYGVKWEELPPELFNLKLCFDNTPKYTLHHNQDIYNSSKINISISHPQCKGYAFPWRIYDIMASNGLLISSYAKCLEDKTKNIVNIPMYKSPYEARDLCIYALKNPSFCEDIISASNEFIEKQGRWLDNLETIQDKTNVLLVDKQLIEKSDYSIYEFTLSKKKKINPLKIKFKNIVNGFSLALSQVPILEFCYTKKIKTKLYSALKKYKTI